MSEIRRRVGAANVVTHSGCDSVEQTRYEVVQAMRQEQMEVSMISEKAEILSIEDDEDFDLAEQIRQASADTPKVVTSWFNGFCEDNLQFAELLKDRFILDEDSYSKKRHLLDITLCDKIDEYKYYRLKVGLCNNDPIGLLMICPNWLLEMDIKFFECSVRTTNVFREQGYPNLKALLRLKSSELLSLRNFGRTSLYRLFDEIHGAVMKGRLGNKAPSLFWFEAFCDVHPEYAEMLKDASITDEITYLEKYDSLIVQLADLIDNFRFEALKNLIDVKNPIALLAICPKWLQELDLKHFECSVRTKNAFENQGFSNLKPLLEFNMPELLRLSNLGRKSINLLSGEILAAWGRGRPPTIEDLNDTNTSLFAEFEKGLQLINDEKKRSVLERRLGYFRSPETLEEIGQDYAITRERIRQIESKTIRKMAEKGYWDDTLTLKLRNLVEVADDAIYLERLGELDPWFAGFDDQIHLLQNIINTFSNFKVYFIQLKSGTAISLIHEHQWRKLVRTTLDNFETSIDVEYTLDDIYLILEAALAEYNSQYLKEQLFDEIVTALNFSSVDDDIVLTSIGNSISSRLATVLGDCETPQHYSKIRDLYEERFGVTKSAASIHSALSANKYWMFARGTFGVERHLPVTLQELEEIAKLSVDVVESEVDKQWTAAEILKQIKINPQVIIPDNFDAYVLNIGLKSFTDLIDLGRSVWMSNSDANVGASRLFLAEAIPRIIRDEGRPMRSKEIEQKLKKIRGTNVNLSKHLYSSPLVAKTDPGFWGLLSRDFGETDEYWNGVLSELSQYLQRRDDALHKSEIENFIKDLEIFPKPKLNLLLGILSKNDIFKIWRGGFIGLSSNGHPNRFSISEALDKSLEFMPDKFNTQQVNSYITKYISYTFADSIVPKLLKEKGYIYEQEERLWIFGH